MSGFFKDFKDINIEIHKSVHTLKENNNLVGWVRAKDALFTKNTVAKKLTSELEDEGFNYLEVYNHINNDPVYSWLILHNNLSKEAIVKAFTNSRTLKAKYDFVEFRNNWCQV